MGPWVSALSAGASDMSAWVLMGLPASIYAFGVGRSWIAIGLAIGDTLSWLIEAPRLRRYSIAAKDSITIPQYLTNRFLSSNRAMQVICAVIFLLAYTIYAASSIKACGTLFNTVVGIDAKLAMYIAAIIIRRLLDGFLSRNADAGGAADRPNIRAGAGTIRSGRIYAGSGRCGILAVIYQLEGCCFRFGLGAGLLWYAAYHYSLHVRAFGSGYSQERENRHYLDTAHFVVRSRVSADRQNVFGKY